MNPLPLIERELRVGARRPGSYRVRFFAALSFVIVWLALLLSDERSSSAMRSLHLFIAFGVLALGFCLLAGIFLTADCLSEEKREGTLGLLFLTNLKGYDVVLGKLASTSLQSIYGLLAIFPVLGLPLMMGGVTVGEFWRVVLVLVVTLLLSLSVGLFVSALSRESRQAMGGTLMGMLLLGGVLPALWWMQLVLFKKSTIGGLLLLSPTHAFRIAFDSAYSTRYGSSQFWICISILASLAFTFLALAALILPLAWQEKKHASGERFPRPTLELVRRELARPLLDENPYLWLVSRDRKPRRHAWAIFAVVCGIYFCFFITSLLRSNIPAFIACLFTSYGLHQLFKSMVAAEATRQLNADRQSGALELLLVTPLTERQIIQGQKAALTQRFMGLGAVLCAVNLCLCAAVWLFPQRLQIGREDRAIFLELFLGGMLMLFLDYKILGTVGIWMALRAKRHNRAILATIGRVMFIPWVAVFLLIFLAEAGRFIRGPGSAAITFAVWFGIGIITDLVMVGLASDNLRLGFRYCMDEMRPNFIYSAPPLPTSTLKPANA
jgi:hypothetical protein